jgi:hypothetical protein
MFERDFVPVKYVPVEVGIDEAPHNERHMAHCFILQQLFLTAIVIEFDPSNDTRAQAPRDFLCTQKVPAKGLELGSYWKTRGLERGTHELQSIYVSVPRITRFLLKTIAHLVRCKSLEHSRLCASESATRSCTSASRNPKTMTPCHAI